MTGSRRHRMQEYIASPLLIDPLESPDSYDLEGRKFHLRVYVLAVGALQCVGPTLAIGDTAASSLLEFLSLTESMSTRTYSLCLLADLTPRLHQEQLTKMTSATRIPNCLTWPHTSPTRAFRARQKQRAASSCSPIWSASDSSCQAPALCQNRSGSAERAPDSPQRRWTRL